MPRQTGLEKLPQGALVQTADPRMSERLHFVEGGGMVWHEDLQNPLKSQVQGCMHVIPMLGRQERGSLLTSQSSRINKRPCLKN